MTAILRPRAFALALLVVALVAPPTSAQDASAIDFGVGYQWLDTTDQTYPFGVNVDVSGRLVGPLRWVGEIGFARDSESDPEFGVSASLTASSFDGGLRWVIARGAVRPYVQVTVGSQRDAYSLRAQGAGTLIDQSAANLMVQPGGGVSVRIADQWGVFGQADFRRVFYEEDSRDEPEDYIRIVTGIRFTLR